MTDIELPDPKELKEKSSSNFSKRVALMTACFAVILAITSLGGNKATKEIIIATQESSNQWAFYQAKTIRENLFKLEKMKLSVELLEKNKALAPDVKAEYERLLNHFSAEEKRYGEEKREIEQKAKEKELERDINLRRDPYLDYAEVLLQISIVLASISIIANSMPVMLMSIFAAIVGTILSVNGFFLLFSIPFFQ